ncbi:MAG: TrmH family RNA methyltransferase [Myxococcota bacterium]
MRRRCWIAGWAASTAPSRPCTTATTSLRSARTCDARRASTTSTSSPGRRHRRGPARGAEHWLQLHLHDSAEAGVAHRARRRLPMYVAPIWWATRSRPRPCPSTRQVCLWFGAELLGVSEEAARAAADGVVCVPVLGMAQSLNVSVAAALALRPVADRARATGEGALLPAAERAAVLEGWLAREIRAATPPA